MSTIASHVGTLDGCRTDNLKRYHDFRKVPAKSALCLVAENLLSEPIVRIPRNCYERRGKMERFLFDNKSNRVIDVVPTDGQDLNKHN